MLELAKSLSDFVIFYNGPKCGASAPDHAHFQAGNKGFLPIEKDWRSRIAEKVVSDESVTLWHLNDSPRVTFVIESVSKEKALSIFSLIYRSLKIRPGEYEPMMNVLALYEDNRWVIFVFPREKHRPACYVAEGDSNLLISPASVDLGGVFIVPLEKDFIKISAEDIDRILSEVCLNPVDTQRVVQLIREQF